jgi:hypothetical protein
MNIISLNESPVPEGYFQPVGKIIAPSREEALEALRRGGYAYAHDMGMIERVDDVPAYIAIGGTIRSFL